MKKPHEVVRVPVKTKAFAMDKQEYIKWLETRGDDPALWGRAECIAADRLVKQTALAELNRWMYKHEVDKTVAEFVRVCASAHFGSAETDTMLMKLDCYPAWLGLTREEA